MPLYLVRWPDLKASLVSARDEDDLLDTLDQVADAEGVTWSVYRGPLWVDFDLPARWRIDEKEAGVPLREDEIVVEDVSEVGFGNFTLSSPGCDHVSEMNDRITQKAFPHVYATFRSGDEPGIEELRAAVEKELQQLMKAEWAVAARDRRTDQLGEIAKALGAPVRQVENILKRTRGRGDPPDPPPKGGSVPKLPRRKRR